MHGSGQRYGQSCFSIKEIFGGSDIHNNCRGGSWVIGGGGFWGTPELQKGENISRMRPPLNKKLFPVHRPGGLKRAECDFFFRFKKNKLFTTPSLYILVYKNGIRKKKNPDLPTGFFKSHPADRKQFVT